MIIHFTRDSVCMGDDMMDNSRDYELSDDALWTDILKVVKEKHFLPHVSGNDVVWVLLNNNGNEIFALYVLKDVVVRISPKDTVKQICQDSNTLHFRYYISPKERGQWLLGLYKGDMYSMWRDGVMEEYKHCQ